MNRILIGMEQKLKEKQILINRVWVCVVSVCGVMYVVTVASDLCFYSIIISARAHLLLECILSPLEIYYYKETKEKLFL